MYIVKEYS